jgi:ATP-dependent helicase/nuclease subunit A
MRLIDQESRDQIRTNFDQNIVVEAAAGTGKTTELIQRIIGLLTAGRTSVEKIIAVTFTEKAAGELKLRLRSELDRARRHSIDATHRQYLDHALAHLEEARISTIHALCADMLRERSIEARVDPNFEVLTEAQTRALYREVFRSWFEQVLESPPEGVRRFLRRNTRGSVVEELIQAGLDLAAWRDFPARWRRDPFNRTSEIDWLVDQLYAFAELTRGPDKPSNQTFIDTAPVRSIVDELKHAEEDHERDYDDLEALFVSLAKDWEYQRFRDPRSGYTRYKENVDREQIKNAHSELLLAIANFVRNANADLAPLLQAELSEAAAEYQLAKNRAGKLDFLDLLIRMQDLLYNSHSARVDFQNRYSHIFVDEFQDTDPLQSEILLLLSADNESVRDWRMVNPLGGKLFIVGDPKQAIYRFRRADVGTYEEVKELLRDRGALLVQLTTSFRSVPAIQHMINKSFTAEIDGNTENLQASYVPLSPFRSDFPNQPAIVAFPVPEPYGMRRFSVKAVEQSLPDAVAAFVSWLVKESGWTVADKNKSDSRIPLSFGHICLLFRRLYSWNDEIARPYIQALEARDIPHLLVGGRSFHDREEVETMRSALTAIEWPDDELSVFATLHGSLFAIRDDFLFEYRHRYGKLHPFHITRELLSDELRPIADALSILRELHRYRNQRPVPETIEILLQETRAYVAFALRPSGEQVLANVLHISELARKYESSGGLSFRGFVTALQGGADAFETGEAAIFEEGGEGVRLTTVYKAKGLEFPVVILADLTGKISRNIPSRHFDVTKKLCAIPLANCEPRELQENEASELGRDRAEGVRVAYVAATRARDLLVVPTIGDHPFGIWDRINESWVSPLNKALYPPVDSYRHAEQSLGCPNFGQDSVLLRPENESADKNNISPGRYHFDWNNAGYDITWWDPKALKLKVRQSFGIRLEELLKPDRQTIEQDLGEYEEWRNTSRQNVDSGSTPSFIVQTASEISRMSGNEGESEIGIVEIPRVTGRPTGARFGTLVHAVLSLVDFDASQELLERTIDLEARILGAPQEETDAAYVVLQTVLKHPLLERARAASTSGNCHRELPITLTRDDGMIIEGIVDLAFLEGSAWTIVDFKTDRDLSVDLRQYKIQVGLYAKAVSLATGVPAVAFVLSI